VTIKAGVVFAGVARFRWLFGTSRVGDVKMGAEGSDTLKGSQAGNFNVIKQDGAVHSKPVA
jgi:hypothetical protein